MALTIPGADGSPVVIQAPSGVPSGSFTSGLGNTILANIFNWLFVIAVILVLLSIVWSGIQWITSQGDKQKVALARSRIVYSIIGLLIIVLSIPALNLLLFVFGGPQFGPGILGTPAPGTINCNNYDDTNCPAQACRVVGFSCVDAS